MSTSDDFLSIQTPENIVFGYEVAGLGTRFIAVALDTILMIIVLIVAGFAATLFVNLLDLAAAVGEGWVIGAYSVLTFLIFWGYFVVFEIVWAGQTPGKRYIGLRVIGRDGTPVGIAASLIRNFVRIADFLPSFYGLGAMIMFATPQTRRLGDLAAGTLVVFDKNVSLDTLGQSEPQHRPAFLKEALGYPVERLLEADVAVAEGWLARQSELETARQLIRPILQRLYTRMDLELEDRLNYDEAKTRLQTIVAGYRSR